MMRIVYENFIYRIVSLLFIFLTTFSPILAAKPVFFSMYSDSTINYNCFAIEKGVVWIGTNKWLLKANKTREGIETIKDIDRISAIYVYTSGKIWLGTDKGILLYDDEPSYKNWPTLGYVNVIAEDVYKNILVGTVSGIYKYNGEDFDILEGTEDYSITAISPSADKNCNIWFGTNHGVLIKHDGVECDSITDYKSTFNHSSITSMTMNTDDELCFVADGKLWRYSDTLYEELDLQTNINCIAIDNAGLKWLGTDNGLYEFDGKDAERHRFDKIEIINDSIKSIIIDEDGVKWIQTPNSLEKLEYKFEKPYVNNKGNCALSISKVEIDSKTLHITFNQPIIIPNIAEVRINIYNISTNLDAETIKIIDYHISKDNKNLLKIELNRELKPNDKIEISSEKGIFSEKGYPIFFTIEFDTQTAVDYCKSPQMKLYPSPSNGVFYVESNVGIDQLEVFSQTGQKIYAKKCKGETRSNVSIPEEKIKQGLYKLFLVGVGGEVRTATFFVE